VFQRYPNGSPPDLGPLIEGFGLQQHLVKPLYMLSTGSRRKVWLSAALAAGAPLTLIDQPFAALDAPSIRFLTEQLHAASQDHSRVWLLADHAPPDGVALAGIIEL
jgi:ABC-type nitrate/sulfonate/bicarbonate transport system ATPase subunit